MNALSVTSKDLIERDELRARINLANRPRLAAGLERLNEVSGMLAANNADRSHFISNPTAFLNEQAIPVSSCNLVEAKAWKAAPNEYQTPIILPEVMCVITSTLCVTPDLYVVIAASGAEAPQRSAATATFGAVL